MAIKSPNHGFGDWGQEIEGSLEEVVVLYGKRTLLDRSANVPLNKESNTTPPNATQRILMRESFL